MLFKVDYGFESLVEYGETISEVVEYDTAQEAEQYGYDKVLEILGDDYDNYDVFVIVIPLEN